VDGKHPKRVSCMSSWESALSGARTYWTSGCLELLYYVYELLYNKLARSKEDRQRPGLEWSKQGEKSTAKVWYYMLWNMSTA
jgi:hypothetical protein